MGLRHRRLGPSGGFVDCRLVGDAVAICGRVSPVVLVGLSA